MGDLSLDTAVEGGAGAYRAELSADWEIWGPNGGYLAAVALRAAGAHSDLPLPASLQCHFLGVAGFAPVAIDVTTLRRGKKAQSMRVSMRQGDDPVLEALVWAVDEGIDGLVHDAAPAPEVDPPAGLPPLEKLIDVDQRPHRFFVNMEERPLHWIADWEHRPAGEPLQRCWYRFRPTPTFDDPWVDAGRLAIVVDTFQWPAAARAHAGDELGHIAPSLDLACRFHRMSEAAQAPWLLVEARSPVAAHGLVAGTAAVWDEWGHLLASGGQQMLSRPAPPQTVD